MKIQAVTAAIIMAVSCGVAVTIMSCNNDNVADAPNTPTHDVKSRGILSGSCNATLSVNRCAAGAAAIAYDAETGAVTASNLNDLTSGISSTFEAAHVWQQAVDITIPEQSGQQLRAQAYDAGQLQSQLDIARDQPDVTALSLTPTFYAGSGDYIVEVYNNGQLVAKQTGVTPGSGPTVAARCGFWRWVKFHIHIGPTQKTQQKGAHSSAIAADAGACEWILSNDLGAGTTITFPDGTTAQGNEVRFLESVDGADRYPYHSTDRVDVLTNIGSYTVLSEFAGI